MNEHGGKRIGAGAKPKDRTPVGVFDTAEEYLTAVVRGDIAPDALRVAAAKALLSYQAPRLRAPVKSKTPGQLHEQAISSVEKATATEFEKKAAKIRSKFAEKENVKCA